MKNLADENHLELGKDIKLIGTGHTDKYREYIRSNRNSTQAVILWCLDSWNINIKNPYSKVTG